QGRDDEGAGTADHREDLARRIFAVRREIAVGQKEHQQRAVIDEDVDPTRFGLSRGVTPRCRVDRFERILLVLGHHATPAIAPGSRLTWDARIPPVTFRFFILYFKAL